MTNEPVTPISGPEAGVVSVSAKAVTPALSGVTPDTSQSLIDGKLSSPFVRLPRPRGLSREARVAIVCASCDLINHVLAPELDREPECEHCGTPLFQRRVFDLQEANFDLHVHASQIPTVVVFWAPWCKPCDSVLMLVDRAARMLEPHLRFARVNTDNERGLVARLGIRGIPTLLLFRRGKEAARRIGSVDFQLMKGWAAA